jgi:ribitol-5-phosphate 2-dehydrogenase
MINAVYRLVAPRKFEIAFNDIDINRNEVIVRPTKLSICNADQRYYQGLREPKVLEKKLPMALIHEAIGEVVYDPTNTFGVGERVVLIPNIPGEKDDFINENYREDSGFCSSGVDGFLQEYIQIPIDRLVSVPLSIPDTTAAFIEFITVSYHAISRLVKHSHERKNSIAVWGDGNLGYTTALLLKKMLPQTKLTVIGLHKYKLSDFTFADETFLANDLPEKLSFDHVLECVGSIGTQNALELIIKYIQPEGTIGLLGVSENPIQINTRMILEKGLSLYGSSRSTRLDFINTINLIEQNEDVIEHLEKIVSAVVNIKTIADIQCAFELDISKSFGKTIMKWNK